MSHRQSWSFQLLAVPGLLGLTALAACLGPSFTTSSTNAGSGGTGGAGSGGDASSGNAMVAESASSSGDSSTSSGVMSSCPKQVVAGAACDQEGQECDSAASACGWMADFQCKGGQWTLKAGSVTCPTDPPQDGTDCNCIGSAPTACVVGTCPTANSKVTGVLCQADGTWKSVDQQCTECGAETCTPFQQVCVKTPATQACQPMPLTCLPEAAAKSCPACEKTMCPQLTMCSNSNVFTVQCGPSATGGG